MKSLAQQLLEAKETARLSTVDMATWFGVNKGTMTTWLNGREPHAYKVPQILNLLALLVKATATGSYFPVPFSVSQYDRKSYVQQVLNGVSGISPRVSKARSSK